MCTLTLNSLHDYRCYFLFVYLLLLFFCEEIITFLSPCQVRGADGDTSSNEALQWGWNGPTVQSPLIFYFCCDCRCYCPWGHSFFGWSTTCLALQETCGKEMWENAAYPLRWKLWIVELCYTLTDKNLLLAKVWACKGRKERSCCGSIIEMRELQLHNTSLQTSDELNQKVDISADNKYNTSGMLTSRRTGLPTAMQATTIAIETKTGRTIQCQRSL